MSQMSQNIRGATARHGNDSLDTRPTDRQTVRQTDTEFYRSLPLYYYQLDDGPP